MDYIFENLGPEKFQEFCSTLINKEYSSTQVFPVGQRDGGRDTIAYNSQKPKKDYMVFQVKFVRNPHVLGDVHKWFTDLIDGEIEKIQNLIPSGASRYILITNVKGTAYLGSGSIDKLNKILEDKINISSQCWWRDDLCRKLDAEPLIKWSFPEILNGQDILNSTIFQNLQEGKERRENIVRAYLTDQYEIDSEVKFKQIDLQNKLFSLFTDVPITLKNYNENNKSLYRALHDLEGRHNKVLYYHSFMDNFAHENGFELDVLGAATFLLDSKTQIHIPRILLEGGPGQGKSTISQYVCQVHRVRILNKKSDLALIPDYLQNTSVRLPFKIDLRDLAIWITKKNPYFKEINEDIFLKIWSYSLESFLIGHVIYHSKNDDFNLNDLIAIGKYSSILIVFDGFDEIADFKIREDIVEVINKGLNRLSANIKSIQVIITSRPAAIANAVGFPVNTYPHFELSNITPKITREYIEKWVISKKISSRDAEEIRALSEEKLNMPHLKDLSKSPMQLAILVNLLYTRGASLPYKRTAIYDSYIDLFFSRESEKNLTIKNNRDLMINIHKYLGWVLHSESETNQNSGRIESTELINKVKIYLELEGHDSKLADSLFTAMQERVCAIVSRIQGTFEFEVQPLREYFCAKYLYETAQYSTAGNVKSGTLPERFDAMSRNPYWHNVLRYFSGCFDRSELPMLIVQLNELQEDSILKYTDYPRIITSQLLSDWVFTQYPKLLRSAIEIIIKGINIGEILNQSNSYSGGEAILLPIECGRTELVEQSFNQLKNIPANDYALELISLINNNPLDTLGYWSKYLGEISKENKNTWIEYGYHLQLLHKLDVNTSIDILTEDPVYLNKNLQLFINSYRFDIIDSSSRMKKLTLDSVLNKNISIAFKSKNYSLSVLDTFLNPSILGQISDYEYSQRTYFEFANRVFNRVSIEINEENKIIIDIKDEIDSLVNNYLQEIMPSLQCKIKIYKQSLEPWDLLISKGIDTFGNRNIFYIISIIAAGIKSKDEKYDEYDNLFNLPINLTKKVRNARLKSGNTIWWAKQMKNSNSIDFILLVFLTWATPKSLVTLYEVVSEIINSFDVERQLELIRNFKYLSRLSPFSPVSQRYLLSNITNKDQSYLYLYIISQRIPEEYRQKVIYDNITTHSGPVRDILESKINYLIYQIINGEGSLDTLKEIKAFYSNLKTYSGVYFRHRSRRDLKDIVIDLELSKSIMNDCISYPKILVSLAEKSCRLFANKNITPVGETATSDNWFSHLEI